MLKIIISIFSILCLTSALASESSNCSLANRGGASIEIKDLCIRDAHTFGNYEDYKIADVILHLRNYDIESQMHKIEDKNSNEFILLQGKQVFTYRAIEGALLLGLKNKFPKSRFKLAKFYSDNFYCNKKNNSKSKFYKPHLTMYCRTDYVITHLLKDEDDSDMLSLASSIIRGEDDEIKSKLELHKLEIQCVKKSQAENNIENLNYCTSEVIGNWRRFRLHLAENKNDLLFQAAAMEYIWVKYLISSEIYKDTMMPILAEARAKVITNPTFNYLEKNLGVVFFMSPWANSSDQISAGIFDDFGIPLLYKNSPLTLHFNKCFSITKSGGSACYF